MRLKVKFCRTFFEMTSLKFLGQAQRMRSGTKNIVGNSAGDNLTRVQLMKERKILRDKSIIIIMQLYRFPLQKKICINVTTVRIFRPQL